jgi:micrococcal nuclease
MAFKKLFCCFSTQTPQIIEWKDTLKFIPPVSQGLCIKVYDGDTITIACKLPYKNSPLYRFSVRLRDIDTPEMRGKTEKEKQDAKKAQQVLSNLVLNKQVFLKNVDVEKYGRILAHVYVDNINLSTFMLNSKLAVPYDGKKKRDLYSQFNS